MCSPKGKGGAAEGPVRQLILFIPNPRFKAPLGFRLGWVSRRGGREMHLMGSCEPISCYKGTPKI